MEPPLEEERGLRRLAWTTTWSAVVVATLVLALVWVGFYLTYDGKQELASQELSANGRVQQRSYSSPVGWAAAVGAAIIFGTCELPIKIPKSQDIGPALFNAYSFLGNGLGHSFFLLLLLGAGEPLEWQWEAVGAAVNIMLVQALARSAIWLLGISVAPPMWCVVGMLTSFAWGTLVFGDAPGSLILSLVGLVFLMAGVTGVSGASVLAHNDISPEDKKGAPSSSIERACGNAEATEDVALSSVVGRSMENDDDIIDIGDSKFDVSWKESGDKDDRHWSALLKGCLYALGAGIADGSLVAFYQQTERKNNADDTSDRQASIAIFSYLGSFGIAMLSVASFLTFALHLKRRVWSGAENVGWTCTPETVAPGIISGFLWAGANSCSVLASHFLGMSVSFPLTQTASVICALLGLFVFGELQGGKARSVFAFALVLILVGAVFLAMFGQPNRSSN